MKLKQAPLKLDMKHAIPDYGEIFPIKDFKAYVDDGCFTADDGSAYISNGTNMGECVSLGELDKLPAYVTHIVWFNK